MTKILLVRHGEAAKTKESADPTLTELGQRQAEQLAQRLVGLSPLSMVSSPKTRALQTAQPLADLWQQTVSIEQAVTEIPSPEGLSLKERGNWIRSLLSANWDSRDPVQQGWRQGILDFLLTRDRDTIVFCHFMVINSAVAHILGDERIQQFRPDYTSVTELSLSREKLEIQRLGAERDSRVL